jgi:hypothetical protein
MKFLSLLAASLLAAAGPAAAQPQGLSVADFLGKAQALMMAGGQVSADNPDLVVLRDEVQAAGKAVRAQQAADLAAGRPATYCLPTDAKTTPPEIIQHLMKIPAAQRGIPFRQAFGDYARAKYPCPAR